MTIDSTLLLIAPEMATIAEGDRVAMSALAAKSVGSVFGDQAELATAYLTAHMLTVRSRAGMGGALKSVKEGDLAYSYAGQDKTDGYNSTAYGIEFMRIRKGVVFGARTRMV